MNVYEGRTQRAHHRLEQADFGVIEKLIKKKRVNNVKAEREDGFGHYQESQNSISRNMGEVNEQ